MRCHPQKVSELVSEMRRLKALVAQSCLTLCDRMDCTSVHGILQASTLEWVAIPFSRGSSSPRDRTWASGNYRWIPYHLATRGAQGE